MTNFKLKPFWYLFSTMFEENKKPLINAPYALDELLLANKILQENAETTRFYINDLERGLLLLNIMQVRLINMQLK
jgi:hypothetical protein